MGEEATPKRSRTTLLEVADRAGVSPTTASLVLTGKSAKHRISRETFDRVISVAEELDYAPNLLVQSMQRGRTHVLSFFSAFRHRIENDLYIDRLSSSIEAAAGRSGYDVLVHCDFSHPPRQTYQSLIGGRADGVILFAPFADDPLLPLFRRSRMPVVLLNARDPAGVLASVADDVHSGMSQVARSLVGFGHRRVASLAGNAESRDSRQRIELLHELMVGLGAAEEDLTILEARTDELGPQLDALLSQKDRPTALFCWHDELAYLVVDACESLGIRIPEELSIVGYDGLPRHAATRHTVASVAVDIHTLGEATVQLLDALICGDIPADRAQTLEVSLKLGTTLGPAATT